MSGPFSALEVHKKFDDFFVRNLLFQNRTE